MNRYLKRNICSFEDCVLERMGRKQLDERKFQVYIPEYLQHACLSWIDRLVRGRSVLLKDDCLQALIAHFLQTSFFWWLEVIGLFDVIPGAVSNFTSIIAALTQSQVRLTSKKVLS
jgi:hypothetical protein